MKLEVVHLNYLNVLMEIVILFLCSSFYTLKYTCYKARNPIIKKPEMAFSSNARLQNLKELANRSTNMEDMAERAKHPVSDGVSL